MPRAYSYIRFSTPEQAEGDSLRRQLELSEEYAEKNHLLLDTSLKLRDLGKSAFSGYNRKKGALSVFLKAVEDRIVKPGSYLLVESLDRLSRDTLSEQMTLFMSLVNAGITVVTLADEQIYNKGNIDSDISRLMMSLVIMMRSHEESLTKSKRLLAAWKQKRADVGTIKLTSVCPHWLVLNPDRKSFQVLEDRAALVRRIFQMSIDGIGQASIARILNQEKVPVFGKNKGWHLSYVHNLLRNRAVLGEYQPKHREKRGNRHTEPVGDLVKDYYPQIIDAVTWQKAQAKKQTATPGRVGQSRGNLFTRIARDGYTGAPMRHIGRGYDKKLRAINGEQPYRHYYLVSDYQRRNPDTKAVSWRYDWFEKWFLDYLVGLDWSTVRQDKIPEEEIEIEKQLAAVPSRMEAVKTELDRLRKLARKTDNPPETIMQDMTRLEADLKDEQNIALNLERELESIRARRVALAEDSIEMKNLVAQGDMPSRMRLREEIRRRIERVDLYPKGVPAEHLTGEPVTAPDLPAFKIKFINGISRWVFCNSRKPEADGAAIYDTGVPKTLELELQERPEVVYHIEKKSRKKVSKKSRKNLGKKSRKESTPKPTRVLVPVYVPRKTEG